MNIFINDDSITVSTNETLLSLLSTHIHTDGAFAVAINGTFIPQNTYKDTLIKEHDRIDIIIPMQGG